MRFIVVAALVVGTSACGSGKDAPQDSSSPESPETVSQCGASHGGAPCPNAKTCATNADCTSATCVTGVCVDPTATDGVQDGAETDVDCGGGSTRAPACADGKKCGSATDCTSGVCSAGVCQVPSATDGVKNGNETDIDCGMGGAGQATSAPKCALGKSCVGHDDCESSACNYKGTCIASKSCTAHHGGDTCGAAPGTDDCCKRLPLADGEMSMDKYNITAGRMRQFVERTNGNMRAWAETLTDEHWDHDWDQYLPTMLDNGESGPDDGEGFTGVYQELGPYVHGAAGPANEGCYVKGNGARTFRLPDDVNARMGDEQAYPQEDEDEKPLVCVTAYMVAALCAWDGGHIPTREQWNAEWGDNTYPWGASPSPAGWGNAYADLATAQQFPPDVNGGGVGDVTYANWNYNYWSPKTMIGTDYSLYIAPPGRFPNGDAPGGFSDLAGSVFNFQDLTGTMVNWSRSGSWQGHAIPFSLNLTTSGASKYWAMGGRCVYAK